MKTVKFFANKRVKTNETGKQSDEKEIFEAFVNTICETNIRFDAEDQPTFDEERKTQNFDSFLTMTIQLSSISSSVEREPVKLRILNKINRRFQLVVPGEMFSLSNDLFAVESRRISISDFLHDLKYE